MANWTAEGFIGPMFRALSKFIAPPGMPARDDAHRDAFREALVEFWSTRNLSADPRHTDVEGRASPRPAERVAWSRLCRCRHALAIRPLTP